jgi:arginyl-tRNA synthetase
MANMSYETYKFDEIIYIVGNEQEYHFNVLFELFKILQWPFREKCKHFSYGMIELPEGKMKSREGNVVDTDDILENMKELAITAIRERYNDLNETEIITRAEIIARGAIYFFFLKQDPMKNFVFDPKNSLAFEGETGPYIQYTHARICSILRKAEETKANLSLLKKTEEKNIVKELTRFQEVFEEASAKYKPNLICHYLLGLCQSVNSYYSKHKVIQENKELQGARCQLLTCVKKTISQGLEILDIKAPERM